MKLFIIDTIGPFFDESMPGMNWSKAPFHFYEELPDPEPFFHRVVERFEIFIEKASALGYNAVSMDDLAHMAILDFYPPDLQRKLEWFGQLYARLFSVCRRYGMRVFVNSDIMYFSPEIEEFTQGKDEKIVEVLIRSLEYLFRRYDVDGVIARIGECDGVDVQGIFKSRLTLKTPGQARTYLQKLLPVFETNGKKFVFRTWTIGWSRLGDLLWNEKTFLQVFRWISSDSLIVSMKYGEADFFRNMDLNPLFFLSHHHTIIELQTKREYDFFWELPYYTGWEYEAYYRKLTHRKNLVGISVWCQTGGWFPSDRITFVRNSSAFVELNTASTIRIFQWEDPDTIAGEFFGNPEMPDFLRAFNHLSSVILYPEGNKKKFFRKLYVSPILWIYWNNVTVNRFTASFVRYFYKTCPKIEDAEFRSLHELGTRCRLPDIDFHIETLRVVYQCRKALHGKIGMAELRESVRKYTARYTLLSFSLHSQKPSKILFVFFRWFFRKNRKFRLRDKILLNRFVVLAFYRLYVRLNRRALPGFINTKGMSVSTIIR